MSGVLYRLRCLLRARWGVALGLIAVVALAGGLALTTAAGALRTLSVSDRYADSRDESFDALVEQNSGVPRNEEIVGLAAVESAHSMTFVFGTVIPEGTEEPAEVLVFAGSWQATGNRVVDGRVPDGSSPGEFLATRTFLDLNGSRIGDRFELVTVSQEQADAFGFEVETPEGARLPAVLVGVLDGATELQDGYALALFAPEMLAAGDVGISASQTVVSLADGATVEDLRAELDGLQEGPGAGGPGVSFGIGAADLVPDPVRAAAEARGQGLLVVAAIIAVATVVVVGQLLGRQVRLSEPESLSMRSIGMTPHLLLADSVARAAVPVVAGAVAAGLLAFGVSRRFPLGFLEVIEPDPGRLLDPLVHLAGPLLLALALLGWVAVAAAAGQRRPSPVGGPGIVGALAPWIRPLPAATAWRFAFARQPGDARSARAPLVGLVVVLGMLVAALTFGTSLGRLLEEPSWFGASELSIGGAGATEVPDVVSDRLAADPDVAGLVLAGTVLTSVGTEALDVSGFLPVIGDLSPPVFVGRLPEGEDEIALGRLDARRFGVGVGDALVLEAPAGERSVRVSGLAVIPGVEGGDGIGRGGMVTDAGLRRLDPGASLGTAFLEVRPDAPAGTVERLSEAVGLGIGPQDRPGDILNLERVRTIPFLVAATLGALAVLGLAHQLILSAGDRRHDIAVLRALGANRRWVSAVVHWQASLVTIVLAVIAVPLGLAGGRVVYRAFVDRIGAQDTVTVPLGFLFAALLALLVLANVAAAVPARRARRASPARHLNQD